jgi:excisionase family DNA binding protein
MISATTQEHRADSEPGWHLFSIKDVAAACRLSEKAVRRAIDDGELRAVKLRSRLRITPQDLAAWIEASRAGTTSATNTPRPRRTRSAPAGTFRAMIQDSAL